MSQELRPPPFKPGEWTVVCSIDELEAFYRARLYAIRNVARVHGYALGLHGSMRRDLDLIAAPWRPGASDADTLAHAVAMAACGIDRDGDYDWEQKPCGRLATSIPICWPDHSEVFVGMVSAGHIDLSVIAAPDVARDLPASGGAS